MKQKIKNAEHRPTPACPVCGKPLSLLKTRWNCTNVGVCFIGGKFLDNNLLAITLNMRRQIIALEADKARMDKLQTLSEQGVVSMCFEMDGGMHVTFEPVGGERCAARNVSSIREGVDAL